MSQKKVTAWRCLVCGYIHEGPEPPGECPVCGAGPEEFEPCASEGPVSQEAPTPAREGRPAGRTIIIGAGAAGLAAATALREASPEAGILLVSSEEALPYYRLNLTRFLAGEVTEADLDIHPRAWYEERGIELVLGADVSRLAMDSHHVTLEGRGEEHFDRLVLATGGHPFKAPLPGADKEGVTALRTVADARRILELAPKGARCVCIGGGILGLEIAGALAARGVQVTVLEGSGHLMPRQLDAKGGEVLARHVTGLGIEVRHLARTAEIVGDHRARGVRLEDGTILEADLVVMAIGIRSNHSLAGPAGLEVRQGIVVDDFLATSHPDVLAAGDVAEHRGVIYGLWGASEAQGTIAGRNAAGLGLKFGGIPRSNTLKVLGVSLFSIGAVQADASSVEVAREDAGRYARFLFQGGRMTGAIVLGDSGANAAARRAVESGADFSAVLAKGPTAAQVLEHLATMPGQQAGAP